MVLMFAHEGSGRRLVVLFGTLLLLAMAASVDAQRHDEVAVIAHPEVSADTIERRQLLDFYSLDIRHWDDDEPVVVFDLRINGSVRDAFYEYLGKSSARMKSVWLKKMLSGEADPPEALKTESEMVRRVASTRGAVGFASRSAVTDSVKVLATIRIEE